MDPAIARRLVELNRAFYDEFSAEFSASRARLHDGIVEVFRRFDRVESLLDVGCGDGRVGRAWAAGRLDVAFEPGRSRYVGVDAAAGLLAARGRDLPAGLELRTADITAGDDLGAGFSHVVSFSVLHHVPGDDARRRVLCALRDALAPGGAWALSVWQIAGKARFADRIVPWDRAGLRTSDVDPGDMLVDWRAGGTGLRYVHHFERDDLVKLMEDNGLRADSVWRSDGRSGDLGLYLMGHRPAH